MTAVSPSSIPTRNLSSCSSVSQHISSLSILLKYKTKEKKPEKTNLGPRPKIIWPQLKGIQSTPNDANLNSDLHHFNPEIVHHQTDVVTAATCDFSSAYTTDKNKTRKHSSRLSQWPWESTEINGTFMRYQMTHQIHLAVNTPQDLCIFDPGSFSHRLSLTLLSTVAGTERGYSPPSSTWPATPLWSAC